MAGHDTGCARSAHCAPSRCCEPVKPLSATAPGDRPIPTGRAHHSAGKRRPPFWRERRRAKRRERGVVTVLTRNRHAAVATDAQPCPAKAPPGRSAVTHATRTPPARTLSALVPGPPRGGRPAAAAHDRPLVALRPARGLPAGQRPPARFRLRRGG